MTDVSVLIPVRDEERWLRETAAAMLAQSGDRTAEFIFADGGSADATPAILAQLAAADPRVRVVDNPAQHVPGGLNAALRVAQGRYVARMDGHAWYPPDYLEKAVARLERGDVVWVTGPAVPRPTGRWARRVALALTSRLGQGGSAKWAGEAGSDAEVDLDTGVFGGVWERATIDRIGGWDEGFVVNEDAEMAGRVLGEGGRIVCLASIGVDYAPRDSVRQLARQYARFGFYRVKTARRHPVALRRSHLASAALTGTVAAAVAAPRPLRAPARAASAVYGGAVAAEALRLTRDPREAGGVAVVLVTMHLAWGAGFLAGLLRHGLPVEGLRRMAGGG